MVSQTFGNQKILVSKKLQHLWNTLGTPLEHPKTLLIHPLNILAQIARMHRTLKKKKDYTHTDTDTHTHRQTDKLSDIITS